MAINVELLMEQLEQAGITNIWFDSAGNMSHENATAQQQQTAQTLKEAHNPNDLSQSQQRAATRLVAAAALKGPLIAALLQSIADDQADITTDAAAVNSLAVLTLVAWKPLMLRLYARQNRILNKLDMVIKVLSHE